VFSDGLLVSGNVITHEDTMTVPLANYNVRSQPDLTVTVTGVSGRVLSVSSIAHPAIEFSQDEDVLTIGPFAMGLTDILTIPTGDEMMNTMDMGLPVDMGAQHDISFPNDMSALSDMQTEPDMNDLGVHTDMAPQTDAHLDMGLTEEERPDSRPMATDSSTPSTGTDGCACAVGTTFSTSGTHGLGFLSLIGIIVLTMPSRRRRHRDV
jgi:hypothetical protein